MSGALSPLIGVISTATLLITPLIITHEPPSRVYTPVQEASSPNFGGGLPQSPTRLGRIERARLEGLGFRVPLKGAISVPLKDTLGFQGVGFRGSGCGVLIGGFGL